MQDAMQSARTNNYSEFSQIIKQKLNVKLSSHPEIEEYSTKYDNIQDKKEQFKNISRE